MCWPLSFNSVVLAGALLFRLGFGLSCPSWFPSSVGLRFGLRFRLRFRLAPGLASLRLSCPPLKSVAYQPEPFSWKPAAVSCFSYFFLPQAGHLVSGGFAQLLKVVFLVAAGAHLYS
jgi:hypothetical protein